MMDDNSNRIELAAQKMRERLAELDAAAIHRLEKNASIDATEAFAYQEWQARAHAARVISLEEAQTIYRAIGPSGWEGRTDLAMRIVITELMYELAKAARHEGGND